MRRSGRAQFFSRPPITKLSYLQSLIYIKDAVHIRDIFYRMGFNDREIVALIGAHTLGRCHADRSGYVGPWTRWDL